MALTRITTQRKNRTLLTFDLEWIPGEDLLDDVDNPKDPVTRRRPKDRTGSLALRVCGVADGPCYENGEKGSEGKENSGTYRSYASIADFLQAELTKKNRGSWFYAHAGGSHDMEFVFDEIIKQTDRMGADAWKVRASFSGASAIIVHVIRGKNAWHFVDSFWLLRDGLANIGKAIGLPKIDEEKRRTKKEIVDYYTKIPMETLVPYNKRDNVILWRAIDAFENTLFDTGGQLQMTIASCAMQLFRRRFLRQDIDTCHAVNVASRAAYFASRVEVFNTYAEDFLIYDINSSFPFSMTFPCPAALKGTRSTIPDSDDERCIYLADVLIEVPDMYAPPIPHRVGGRVFFPVGRWRSWLSSVDIRLLLRKGGRILKVFEVLEFDYFEDLKDYALKVYGMRKESKTSFEKLVYKYLLNALYGKFAETAEKESILINPDKIDRRVMQMIMPGVWSKTGVVPVAHMHVPISVHITALARRTLYNHLEECEKQNEAFHYTDTDSVATNAKLPTGGMLGALKLEKKIANAIFKAPKVYMGDGWELQKDGTWTETSLNKAKGFSLPKNPEEARKTLLRIIEGGEIEVQRMARLRELYRTGRTEPVEIIIKKALTGLMLSKRFHYPDGTTRPWSIDELYSGNMNPIFSNIDPFTGEPKRGVV
jgi:hypothetical protein